MYFSRMIFLVHHRLMWINVISLCKTFVAGIIRLFNTFVLATNAINIIITFFRSSIHKPSFIITLQNWTRPFATKPRQRHALRDPAPLCRYMTQLLCTLTELCYAIPVLNLNVQDCTKTGRDHTKHHKTYTMHHITGLCHRPTIRNATRPILNISVHYPNVTLRYWTLPWLNYTSPRLALPSRNRTSRYRT